MAEALESAPVAGAYLGRAEGRRRLALPSAQAGQLLVAVVHSARDVRFVTACSDVEALLRRLAAYVRERAPDTLWPDEARMVRALLEAGKLVRAIERYLDAVGDRWDAEWLTVTTATADLD